MIYQGGAKVSRQKANRRNRQYVLDYLATHPCVDCGETDPIVLEFDHISGQKMGNIADASSKAWALKKLVAEIAKCEVRCANCHRRVTYNRRNSKTKDN